MGLWRKRTPQALFERFAPLSLAGFTGSARDVVDHMESWHAAGACDGFMIQVPYMPGGLEDFSRLAVPELQRRGLFRTGYSGTTLREHLGLPRTPA